MEVDGVRGQARVTFRGVPTAVPTGCCQATVGPEWPLSALQHLPRPISSGRHTFASKETRLDITVAKKSNCTACTRHERKVKWNSQCSYWWTVNGAQLSACFQVKGSYFSCWMSLRLSDWLCILDPLLINWKGVMDRQWEDFLLKLQLFLYQ